MLQTPQMTSKHPPMNQNLRIADSRLQNSCRYPAARATEDRPNLAPVLRGSSPTLRRTGVSAPSGGLLRSSGSSPPNRCRLLAAHCTLTLGTPPSAFTVGCRVQSRDNCCLFLWCGVLPRSDGSCLDHGQDRVDIAAERHQCGSDIDATLAEFCFRNLERNIDCGRQPFGGDFVGLRTYTRVSASRM